MQEDVMSDENLVSLYLDGDNDALLLLVSRYIGKIDRKLRAYPLLKEDVDDAKQEALISFLSAVRSYCADRGASFVTYADRCFDNAIRNHIVRLSTKKFLLLKNAVSIGDVHEKNLMDASSNNPEEIYINKERYNRLLDKIDVNLSEFEKNVLLSYLDGNSYTDISKEFNSTPKAVDNALQRVRRKLKSVFD